MISQCIGLVRKVIIIFLPTRCRGFGLVLELGPQKGPKRVILTLCRSIFRPRWPIAIKSKKCAQKPGGRRAPPPQPRIKWYGCLAPRSVMYIISGDRQTGAAIAPLSASAGLSAGWCVDAFLMRDGDTMAEKSIDKAPKWPFWRPSGALTCQVPKNRTKWSARFFFRVL